MWNTRCLSGGGFLGVKKTQIPRSHRLARLEMLKCPYALIRRDPWNEPNRLLIQASSAEGPVVTSRHGHTRPPRRPWAPWNWHGKVRWHSGDCFAQNLTPALPDSTVKQLSVFLFRCSQLTSLLILPLLPSLISFAGTPRSSLHAHPRPHADPPSLELGPDLQLHFQLSSESPLWLGSRFGAWRRRSFARWLLFFLLWVSGVNAFFCCGCGVGVSFCDDLHLIFLDLAHFAVWIWFLVVGLLFYEGGWRPCLWVRTVCFFVRFFEVRIG